MLTGDRREVAEAIGVGLGVDEVLAEQSPAHKLAVIKAAREMGPTVMVGDGVNDAPALAAATVGVALGARGATASAEAADIVLLVDRLDRLAEALHIARRTRAIAVQSVIAGMGLSLLAMLVAAAGYLPPLSGAVVQELIDVAVILNALRALRIHPLRASRFSLTAEESERLHAEHRELAPVLDRLGAVAERLPTLQGAERELALHEADDLLRERLLPHEREDDHQLYPAIAALLGGDDPLAAMSRTHREIFRLHQRFAALVERLPQQPEPGMLQDLQRTLYALDAILRLHFAQEEEIYQSLARD
jgi:iron-sulfur cluster repair protein YtfE (RIC family)